MREIFGGALLSQVKCLSCKGESNKTDEMMDISLDLFQSFSLNDALSRFFQPEILDGTNKYSCSNCKKLSVARKQMFILRAPNVLVIQLKRFEPIHGGKINRNIDFEEGLVLSKFMSVRSQDPQPEYSLLAASRHSGYSRMLDITMHMSRMLQVAGIAAMMLMFRPHARRRFCRRRFTFFSTFVVTKAQVLVNLVYQAMLGSFLIAKRLLCRSLLKISNHL
ncbi:hypothetical protein J5N97_010604 [Dioscorea zingiberensis]|uniref:ubiquitinyl hydrolase 1 n=1 Tax=Dioscorea zingiberensis TaxID=325984 RepID=A0A9D5D0D3_9LILI|nr:hypothetical protein J5N97_010604 [Dioscorea zingiberensis]